MRLVHDEDSAYSEVSNGETENACFSLIDNESKMSNLKLTIGKAKKGGLLYAYPSNGPMETSSTESK